MKTSKEIVESPEPEVKIPLHGDFKLYRFEAVCPGPRIVEGWMGAGEFRDNAVKARRRAKELLEAADSMDAWLVSHI